MPNWMARRLLSRIRREQARQLRGAGTRRGQEAVVAVLVSRHAEPSAAGQVGLLELVGQSAAAAAERGRYNRQASMNSDLRALLATLDRIVVMLKRYGEKHWSWWVEHDAQQLRRGDLTASDHFISSFGGMGSFNDVYLCPQNGATILPDEVTPVNRELQRLQSVAYEQAVALQGVVGRGRA
jgi:hypothetical protein